MQVRKATHSDLDQLVELFNGYRVFYRKEADLVGARAFLTERMDAGDSEIYVCEVQGGTLAGFTQLYPLFTSTRMGRIWLLNDLFVHPDHRGQGHSVRLIDRAKQLVRDTGAYGMFLETERSNDIGNSLYPRVGMRLNDGSNYYEWEP